MSDQNEQKTEVTSYEEDMKKYTKIDNLDEDPVVESGKFFLTILKQGQVVTRKFFDAGNASQIEFDAK
jgi:hypothetical protein